MELYLGYQTPYVSNTATKDTQQKFVEALLNQNTGNGKSNVIQRSPDGSTESALDYIVTQVLFDSSRILLHKQRPKEYTFSITISRIKLIIYYNRVYLQSMFYKW